MWLLNLYLSNHEVDIILFNLEKRFLFLIYSPLSVARNYYSLLKGNKKNIFARTLVYTGGIKEHEIERRYNWRGPPYHMIIHALQTVLHFFMKYSE